MKAISVSILLTCLMLASCKDETASPAASSSKKATAATGGADKKAKKAGDDLTLKQNGDYSELFYHSGKDNSIASETEIADTLKISEDRVKKVKRSSGDPTFTMALNDGTISVVGIQMRKQERKYVDGDIRSYVESAKDSKSMRAEISDTGDSWICTHGYNGWVLIYNTNYDAMLNLTFNHEGKAAGKGFTAEQKEEARVYTTAIANMLLKKFQKEKA